MKVRAISQYRLHEVLNLDYLGVYRSLQQSLKALFKSPIFLAILFELAWSAGGGALSAPLQKTLSLLSGAAAPVALFMIGGMLVGQQLAGRAA